MHQTHDQRDFALGMKELDQEAAREEDHKNFILDEDIRDYDEFAKSLKVFCISSPAYRKLSGCEKACPGFRALKETEIPQLLAHRKLLTEAN